MGFLKKSNTGQKLNHGHQLKSELYIQALSPGFFTRFENSENRPSPAWFKD